MYFITNKNTDPAFNLALEEYVLTQTQLDAIMLWRNSKAVIIGANQNAAEEIDADFVKENDIAVIRRQSGGGAVFHDLGNINFTVIHARGDDDFSNYEKFTAPICAFLQGLGVDARLEGRNDLVIDGMKFSGNAQAVKKDRIMHHGTILFDADFAKLAGALKPRDVKIESKGVKSVRARVTNVASHLPYPMPVEVFFELLADYFRQNVPDIEDYELSPADAVAVGRLVMEKYAKWEWNFGQSPAYTYENARKFPYGLVELRLAVAGGVIEAAHIYGDFFGVEDKSELEALFSGVRHDRAAVKAALAGVDPGRYIHGMTADDLLGLF